MFVIILGIRLDELRCDIARIGNCVINFLWNFITKSRINFGFVVRLLNNPAVWINSPKVRPALSWPCQRGAPPTGSRLDNKRS